MLFYRFAINFHFEIVVKFIAAVAVAVQSNITGPDSFGIYKLALMYFSIVFVLSDPQA